MLGNNQHINWLPDHIKTGRFGKFLESNVDWSLSRERYWGTPLPIWHCGTCGHQEAIDSYEALCAQSGVAGLDVWEKAKKADPDISEHLKVHKPYIDAVTFDCPKCASDQSRARKEAVTGRANTAPTVSQNDSGKDEPAPLPHGRGSENARMPQFVATEQGHLFFQFVSLGVVFALATILVFGGIALTAGTIGGWLRSAKSQAAMNRVTAVVLIALALLLLADG